MVLHRDEGGSAVENFTLRGLLIPCLGVSGGGGGGCIPSPVDPPLNKYSRYIYVYICVFERILKEIINVSSLLHHDTK